MDYNKTFYAIQQAYLKTNKEIYLKKLYKIIYNLSKRYIVKYGKNNKVYINDIDIKAHDVAVVIIERKFIRKSGKPIKKITSYIYYDCLHEITKNAKYERFINGNNEIFLQMAGM